MNNFSGDPAFKIDKNGSTLVFREGQPVMDQGFENAVLISLLTERNWPGNALLRNESNKIGSDVQKSNKLPINRDGLNKRSDAITKALQWAKTDGLFKDVIVSVTNPSGSIILANIRIIPPNGEAVNLTLENFGLNWRMQKENPAHRRF